MNKNDIHMKPVIQEELTGCGIACSAAIAGLSYKQTKNVANSIGINADDPLLWSEAELVIKLLAKLGIETDKEKVPFERWDDMPNCALISIKWHLEKGRPFWHWAVFIREGAQKYVLDSKKSLKRNIRTDFGRIKPKWYIKVNI